MGTLYPCRWAPGWVRQQLPSLTAQSRWDFCPRWDWMKWSLTVPTSGRHGGTASPSLCHSLGPSPGVSCVPSGCGIRGEQHEAQRQVTLTQRGHLQLCHSGTLWQKALLQAPGPWQGDEGRSREWGTLRVRLHSGSAPSGSGCGDGYGAEPSAVPPGVGAAGRERRDREPGGDGAASRSRGGGHGRLFVCLSRLPTLPSHLEQGRSCCGI